MHSKLIPASLLHRTQRLILAIAVSVCLLAASAIAVASPSVASGQAPAAQALKIYQAIRDQDFRALFHLVAFTEQGKSMLTTAEQFDIDVRRGYDSSFKTPEEKAATDAILHSISDIMVGEAVISGNTAAVPTSARITVGEQTITFKGVANLRLDDGVWKLDLTFDEDSEKTMSQRTSELLGEPVRSAP